MSSKREYTSANVHVLIRTQEAKLRSWIKAQSFNFLESIINRFSDAMFKFKYFQQQANAPWLEKTKDAFFKFWLKFNPEFLTFLLTAPGLPKFELLLIEQVYQAYITQKQTLKPLVPVFIQNAAEQRVEQKP